MDLLIAWACETSEAHQRDAVVDTSETAKQIALSRTAEEEGFAVEWLPNESAIRPFLRSGKVSRPDQIRLVKMAMTEMRLRAKEANSAEQSITTGDILRYYRRHHASFETVERRDIRAVMNRDKRKILVAKREMKAGVPFRIVERRFNQSAEGGLHLGREPHHLGAPYEEDYFSAPLHVLIGPRKEVYYYIFEVFHRTPARERPLPEVHSKIVTLLARFQADRQAKVREASWHQRTTCLTGYLGDRCGRHTSRIPG